MKGKFCPKSKVFDVARTIGVKAAYWFHRSFTYTRRSNWNTGWHVCTDRMGLTLPYILASARSALTLGLHIEITYNSRDHFPSDQLKSPIE